MSGEEKPLSINAVNRSPSVRAGRTAAALAAAAFLVAPFPCLGIVSSFPTTFTGTNINTLLGADRFYSAGYTGSRAIVANIEAGWVWNGQESLTNVTTYFAHSSITGQFDRHATWTGAAIAGRPTVSDTGEHRRGIAYGATLWSGAMANVWAPPGTPNGYSLGFGFSGASFSGPYTTALVSGIGGQTADVINSSWSTGSGANGNTFQTLTLDALVFATGKTLIVSAGNSGPSPNTLFSPAWALNNIAVGALGTDTTIPQYGTVSTFSSRSPSDFFVPTAANGISGSVLSGVRAAVDIAAPGQNLTLANYSGPTGGNAFGGPSSLAANLYNGGLNGTSFASPLVAGGAALLVDAGKALYPANALAIDGRVIKAVLLNAADKTSGWNNGQTLTAGVVTTTQSLDYLLGAGRMNLSRTFDQYTAGTTDLAGLVGGAVQNVGWDFGRVEEDAPQDYLFSGMLAAGSRLTATLDWFANGQGSNYGSFDNLDLQVWSAIDGVPQTLMAQSISGYNTTEHLSFDLPSDGQYLMRVAWTGNVYNFGYTERDTYGLAWDVTAVPEPMGGTIFVALAVIAATRRRR